MTHLYAVALLDVVALAVIFVAVVRIVATPAPRWGHGRLSKTAWVIATLWWTPSDHGFVIPVAAIVAIWHTRRLNRSETIEPPDLPFAEGTPEPAVGSEEES
jgi:hypothetical protein